MTEAVRVNDAIEGAKISGKSRDPLRNRGLCLILGHRVFKFTASFNVEANNKCALSPPPIYEPNAAVAVGDSIRCDGAVLYSAKAKYSTTLTMGSATHQINKWDFPQHTSARINMPHQELINGIQKREAEQRALAQQSPAKALNDESSGYSGWPALTR